MKYVSIGLIIFLLSVMRGNAQETNEIVRLKKNVEKEFYKHPKMEAHDIYKFLHQAAMGSEHAVKDTASARAWMENEIAGLEMTVNEALIDSLSPNGEIVRVNLRPYLTTGYSSEKLLNAFINTANNYKGSTNKLKIYLKAVLDMINNGNLKLDYSNTKIYFDEMSGKGFPAVHHSKEYEKVYNPAYRVVDIKYLNFINKK